MVFRGTYFKIGLVQSQGTVQNLKKKIHFGLYTDTPYMLIEIESWKSDDFQCKTFLRR